MFSKGKVLGDGSFAIPKDLYERWVRQMNTEYPNLPEKEKQSDRVEADSILDIIQAHKT